MRTIGVKRLVEKAMSHLREPYTEDVIEDVFSAIERHHDWLVEYQSLCDDLTKTVVNNWVGMWVSKYVGRSGSQQVTSTKSKLAGSYSKLTSPIAKLGGKRKEPEALQLMADYYRANKSSLPVNIRDYRQAIVALLMEGMSPAEAFALAPQDSVHDIERLQSKKSKK